MRLYTQIYDVVIELLSRMSLDSVLTLHEKTVITSDNGEDDCADQ